MSERYQVTGQRARARVRQLYGDLERTTCPMALHLDAVAGDDAADGTADHPLRTFDGDLIPDSIEHRRDIVLEPGTYGATTEDLTITRRVSGPGQLRIIGHGAPVAIGAAQTVHSVSVLTSGRVRVSAGGVQ